MTKLLSLTENYLSDEQTILEKGAHVDGRVLARGAKCDSKDEQDAAEDAHFG